MQGIQCLNLNSTPFLREEALFAFAQPIESNLEDLKHEVHHTKQLLERREKRERYRQSTFFDFTFTAFVRSPYPERRT